MENNTEFNEKLSIILQNEIIKAVVSNPDTNAKFRKIEIENKHDHFLISAYTEKQVFHQNIAPNNLEKALVEFAQNYKQFNFFGAEYEYMLKISKKNKVFYSKTANKSQKIAINSQNNRQKNYILPEGTVIAPLVDMGIFTPQGKIIASMYDKFKQINRFIEIIDDSLKNQELEHLNIIDFGCGKSYLTFIIYYYFTEIKKIDVNIIGLDLKTDVIENCNKTALKYGYKNLHFEQGDIAGFDAKMPIDMVITLHACDTATDYALLSAIKWGAKMIFSVPCCQHQVNAEISGENLGIITRYGVAKERISALYTDIIRCNLLSACGYKVQLLEFIDFEHTPKNLLIRANISNIPQSVKAKMLDEVEKLQNTFGFSQTLYLLLKQNNLI